MIVIRDSQMMLLAQAEWPAFAARMVPRLRQHFPDICEPISDPELTDIITVGLQRAGTYGFNKRRDLSRFINLMFIFGHQFDHTEYWAHTVLASDLSADQKASNLYAEGIMHEAEGTGLGKTRPEESSN